MEHGEVHHVKEERVLVIVSGPDGITMSLPQSIKEVQIPGLVRVECKSVRSFLSGKEYR